MNYDPENLLIDNDESKESTIPPIHQEGWRMASDASSPAWKQRKNIPLASADSDTAFTNDSADALIRRATQPDPISPTQPLATLGGATRWAEEKERARADRIQARKELNALENGQFLMGMNNNHPFRQAAPIQLVQNVSNTAQQDTPPSSGMGIGLNAIASSREMTNSKTPPELHMGLAFVKAVENLFRSSEPELRKEAQQFDPSHSQEKPEIPPVTDHAREKLLQLYGEKGTPDYEAAKEAFKYPEAFGNRMIPWKGAMVTQVFRVMSDTYHAYEQLGSQENMQAWKKRGMNVEEVEAQATAELDRRLKESGVEPPAIRSFLARPIARRLRNNYESWQAGS